MSAELVNLRRARKARRRAEAAADAAANRARFGGSLADRTWTQRETARAERAFDGHRIEEDAPPSGRGEGETR
jgi:hypothetical protein